MIFILVAVITAAMIYWAWGLLASFSVILLLNAFPITGPLLLGAVSFLVFVWVVWALYAAVMNVKRVRDNGQLSGFNRAMGYVALFVGLPMDFLLNLVACVILLDDLHEPLLSGKIWRLSNGPDGWRKRWAIKFREKVLDHLDPDGVHEG